MFEPGYPQLRTFHTRGTFQDEGGFPEGNVVLNESNTEFITED